MAKQFTLGKRERLKSRKSIEQLFSAGKGFTVPSFRALYLLGDPAGQFLQFGTGASSKNFKKAIDRNRIKRLSREAWRLQKAPLQEILKEQNQQMNVFLIYTARELPGYNEVYEKVGKIIAKLCNILASKK